MLWGSSVKKVVLLKRIWDWWMSVNIMALQQFEAIK